MKQKIIERILEPYPQNSHIVKNSTPVIAFGNPLTARVATVGINPSSAEFLKNGKILPIGQKRLEDFDSLGITSANQLNQDLAEKILAASNSYFQNNPYMQWFGDFEENVLRNLSSSYLTGDACHLDLIQWPTDPVWGSIKDKTIKSSLLKNDLEFLSYLLALKNIKVIFLGSSIVYNQLKKAKIIDAQIVKKFEYNTTTNKKRTINFYKGTSNSGALVLGWSRTFARQYISPKNFNLCIEKLNEFVKGS